MFGAADVQAFSIRTSDEDGEDWVGLIEVTNANSGILTMFSTLPQDSGEAAHAVALPPLPIGRYRWRARAVDTSGRSGPWSAESDFSVGTNRAPHAPALLAPAEDATLRRLGNGPFSISAVDPDGDVVSGTVSIRNANGDQVAAIETSPTVSGGVSSALPADPMDEGSYTWSARAIDLHGFRSEWSPSRSFTVGPPPTGGGGVVVGTVAFDAPGIPATLGVCERSSSSFSLESGAAVVNTAIVGFVGAVSLDGRGSSDCESGLLGEGALVLDATGTGPTGSTLTCADLAGEYSRIATAVVLSLKGGCRINNLPVSRVTMALSLQFAPNNLDAGTTTRIETASLGGTFVVVPE